jgi:hypothetical protein
MGGVDVQIHIFSTSKLAGGEWSASRPGHFTRGTHWIGGWVEVGRYREEIILTLPGLELRPLGSPARSQSLYWLRYPGSYVSPCRPNKISQTIRRNILTPSSGSKSKPCKQQAITSATILACLALIPWRNTQHHIDNSLQYKRVTDDRSTGVHVSQQDKRLFSSPQIPYQRWGSSCFLFNGYMWLRPRF